jgi:uncharacterized membrane protein
MLARYRILLISIFFFIALGTYFICKKIFNLEHDKSFLIAIAAIPVLIMLFEIVGRLCFPYLCIKDGKSNEKPPPNT